MQKSVKEAGIVSCMYCTQQIQTWKTRIHTLISAPPSAPTQSSAVCGYHGGHQQQIGFVTIQKCFILPVTIKTVPGPGSCIRFTTVTNLKPVKTIFWLKMDTENGYTVLS